MVPIKTKAKKSNCRLVTFGIAVFIARFHEEDILESTHSLEKIAMNRD